VSSLKLVNKSRYCPSDVFATSLFSGLGACGTRTTMSIQGLEQPRVHHERIMHQMASNNAQRWWAYMKKGGA
jgi:hypothetical protein